jgi:hypothetical protein
MWNRHPACFIKKETGWMSVKKKKQAGCLLKKRNRQDACSTNTYQGLCDRPVVTNKILNLMSLKSDR